MNYKIKINSNRTKQIEQALKVLTSWIGEPNSNSSNSLTFLTIQNNSTEIQSLYVEPANNLQNNMVHLPI